MVSREQNCALVLLELDPLELRRKKIQLDVRDSGPLTSLAGDQTGVF